MADSRNHGSASDLKPLNPDAYPFLKPESFFPLVCKEPIWAPSPSSKLPCFSQSPTSPYLTNLIWWSANGYFYNLSHPQPTAFIPYHYPTAAYLMSRYHPMAITCYDVRFQMPTPLSLDFYDRDSQARKFEKAVGDEQPQEESVRNGKIGCSFTKGIRGFDVKKSRKRFIAEKCSKTKMEANRHNKGSNGKSHPTFFSIVPAESTTVMIKNIPNQFKRRDLLHILDSHCRAQNRNNAQSLSIVSARSEFDFFYLPMDFWFWFEGKISNLGYAFVNFTTSTAALRFWQVYHRHEWEVTMSKKVCQISWAKIQGKMALKQSFKNKIFWCHSDHFLPVILAPPSDGSRLYKPITIGKRIASVPPKPLKRSF